MLGGRPRISGRRVSVEQIVVWHEWLGRSADEIATEYDLTLADVYAALAYYYDQQAEMDERIQDSQHFIDEVRQQIPSTLLFQENGHAINTCRPYPSLVVTCHFATNENKWRRFTLHDCFVHERRSFLLRNWSMCDPGDYCSPRY